MRLATVIASTPRLSAERVPQGAQVVDRDAVKRQFRDPLAAILERGLMGGPRLGQLLHLDRRPLKSRQALDGDPLLLHHPLAQGDPQASEGGGGKGTGTESGTGTILTRWGVLDYGAVMPRTARVAPVAMVFHVLNRGVARMHVVRGSGRLPSIRAGFAGYS
jgi:hypothetical protein